MTHLSLTLRFSSAGARGAAGTCGGAGLASSRQPCRQKTGIFWLLSLLFLVKVGHALTSRALPCLGTAHAQQKRKPQAREAALSTGAAAAPERGTRGCRGTGGQPGRAAEPGSAVGQPGWAMLGWLLAALAALAQGGAVAARDISCWKKCGSPKFFHCSWPPLGPAGNTSYVLNFCSEKRSQCSRFEVGAVTNYSPRHGKVFFLENLTAWVEARWGHQVHRTPNHTLYLNKAVKLDPPPSEMPFSKTGGQLRVQVPKLQCHGLEQPPQHEARFWRVGDSSWTQVTCETVTVTGGDVSVTCALGVNGTFVVQLRHKFPDWSSYWSDWSSNISVPEEILRSPVLSHHLGKLGRDGQRVLRLSWQPVLKEQRNVTYKLDVHMLACGCAESDEEDSVELGWEETEYNLTLSGAEYEILLTAANAAGPGPARQLRVPPEQRADLSFKEISVAGGAVTAQWEAPVPGDAFCFEQQTLPGPPKQGVCVRQEFPANSSHVQSGKPAPQAPRCPPSWGKRV
ncbi:PREDICTED: interleukin-12 receptor subunit beta-1 [Ficedula albicollis]|uniref:interleukin-12 receptor subunit beta-1 n=1 Tax=Ficedula albicollis TaxID=59894 RepID=UPI000359BDE2|nr:PREDICTED: interleukin-12 receptor subunit beta-1 [Ficedula albicollis]